MVFHARRRTRESCRLSVEPLRSQRLGHLAPQQMAHPAGHAGTPQLTVRESIDVHQRVRQDSRVPRRDRAMASRMRVRRRPRALQPRQPARLPGNAGSRAEWPPQRRRRQACLLTIPRPFERPLPPMQCTGCRRRDELPPGRVPTSSAPGRRMPPGPRVPGNRWRVDQPSRLDRRTGPRNLSTSARNRGERTIEGCPMRLAMSRGSKPAWDRDNRNCFTLLSSRR